MRGKPINGAVYERAAQGLRAMEGAEAIDTVVLACTHFPLVEAGLADAFGAGVRFVDGAQGIARRIAYLTAGQRFERSAPDIALFTRGGEDADSLAPALARCGIERIEVL